MLRYKFIIRGRPRPKKNNQIATKQRFIIQNKEYREYEKDAIRQVKGQYLERPIQNRVFVAIKYYLADGREADLPNMDNAICDILERAGVVKNDKQVIACYSKKVAINRRNPRAEVIVIPDQADLYEAGDEYEEKNNRRILVS